MKQEYWCDACIRKRPRADAGPCNLFIQDDEMFMPKFCPFHKLGAADWKLVATY
ncbi:MAG: hypothetical protein ACTSWQ_06680 [Candidatus Thorarchaeota archaeon]